MKHSFIIALGASMRKLFAITTAGTLTAAVFLSSVTPAFAQEAKSPEVISLPAEISPGQVTVGIEQDLEAETQREGNTATITVGEKTTVVTKDPESGDILIDSANGQTRFTQAEIEELRQGIENDLSGSGMSVFSEGVETDWKKYLCAAAAEAAVTGHGTAWQKAIELATKSIKTGKANPWLIGASFLFHFGAGVFLGVQC